MILPALADIKPALGQAIRPAVSVVVGAVARPMVRKL